MARLRDWKGKDRGYCQFVDQGVLCLVMHGLWSLFVFYVFLRGGMRWHPQRSAFVTLRCIALLMVVDVGAVGYLFLSYRRWDDKISNHMSCIVWLALGTVGGGGYG